MQRYFLKFSYIGTRLRGIQRQPEEVFNEIYPFTCSVQTILDRAFQQQFEPDNDVNVCISSRTDQGVHAFCNTAHVDLQHKDPEQTFHPEWLFTGLNRYLDKAKTSIKINEVLKVPETFHSRYSALSRTYLYRLGITPLKKTPIAEQYRCQFVERPFDIEKAKAASEILNGVHDFASFYHGFLRTQKKLPTVRRVEIDFSPGKPLLDPRWDPLYENTEFWDVRVKSKAFLYKQVRRMVGVIVAAGQNRMSLGDVRLLLEKPGYWNTRALTAEPYGLYLVDIEYDSKAFLPTENEDGSCRDSEESSLSPSRQDKGNDCLR